MIKQYPMMVFKTRQDYMIVNSPNQLKLSKEKGYGDLKSEPTLEPETVPEPETEKEPAATE